MTHLFVFLLDQAEESRADELFHRGWPKLDVGLPNDSALQHLFSGFITPGMKKKGEGVGREKRILSHTNPITPATITELVWFIEHYRQKKVTQLAFLLETVGTEIIKISQEVIASFLESPVGRETKKMLGNYRDFVVSSCGCVRLCLALSKMVEEVHGDSFIS